jgi:hypothetical protein
MSSSFDEHCGDARAKYSSRCIVQLAFQFAIPSRVVSSSEFYVEPPTPQTSTSFTENLGLTAPIQAPGLSERNLACLKVLVSSAFFLAGSLGESWYGILEALQDADCVSDELC